MSWLLPITASLAVLSFALMACASAPAQAPDPAATTTPTPTPTAEEQASDPGSNPTSTPTLTPTATPAPEQSSGPGPAATTTLAATTTRAATATLATTTTRATTTTQTTTTVVTTPPLGSCFEGTLSEDPLHCYVLGQADAQGLIDIVGVYGGGGPLYVSISQDELSVELFRFTYDKSYEFAEKWPELVPYEKYGQRCSYPHERSDFPGCYLAMTGVSYRPERILPLPSAYERVLLAPGGDAGRRKVPGWASWRKLWPALAAGASGASAGTGLFDVSDVNVTSFPEIDCELELSYGCDLWKKLPNLGFAGGHGDTKAAYYQVKNPPTDEAGLHALKKKIDPCYDVVGRCTYVVDGVTWAQDTTATSSIVIIPVKYDFAQLWRWATILDRFAVSAGNTLGILDATVFENFSPIGTVESLNVNGVPAHTRRDPSSIRETILIVARRDVQRVADALPVLLPQLGIPVDAVGVVELYWE